MAGAIAIGAGHAGGLLVSTIFSGGIGAFRQTYLTIPVTLDASVVDKKGNRATPRRSRRS
jgi:phosphate transport system permease protein